MVILGPTAGGKSELAVALAEYGHTLDGHPGEVISADSMQVYRHMDAGTAKPKPALRRRAAHHMIDCVEPTERFTVHDWLQRTNRLIEQLRAAGKRPIIVGGTNLYLKALLEGLFDGPPADPALRDRLAAMTTEALHTELAEVDPPAADRIHRNDRKRLTRALEVYHHTGAPISSFQQQWERSPATGRAAGSTAAMGPGRYHHDPILIGLTWPAALINRRINRRVRDMFHPEPDTWPGEPLPAETARLEAAGLLGPQAREALGYKQVLAALAGHGTMGDAEEQTRIQTRRFAKQQRTWLKRFEGVRWIEADKGDAEDHFASAKEAIGPAVDAQ